MTLKITARHLETAARRFLVKCAAGQPRSSEGTLVAGDFHRPNGSLYQRVTSNTQLMTAVCLLPRDRNQFQTAV